MDILFVYPNKENLFFKDNKKQPAFHYLISKISPFPKAITFPLLASITPKKYNIELVEGDINNIDFNKEYSLVGISCITSTAFIAYKIADEFRKRGTPIVLGGWHPSALPEEAKQHADSVVIGEAEDTWPQLLKDFEKEELKSFYYQINPVDPKMIPFPQNIYPKGSTLAIQATRGCPHGCEFCSMTNMKFRRVYRTRPIEDVMNEIRSHPRRHFGFHDNSLTIDPKYTKELFRRMKKEGINKKFFAMGNINTLGKDDELLRLASEAGCKIWFIGFESISQESLNEIGKTSNKVEEYPSAIKKIHDYGMIIHATFVFGFDKDTIEIFDKTDEFVRAKDIDQPRPLPLTPLPGTPLFNRMEKENRILTKDWNKYDLKHVVFQPKNMTPEELRLNVRELHKRWYKNSAILKRSLKNLKNGLNSSITTFFANYHIKAWI